MVLVKFTESASRAGNGDSNNISSISSWSFVAAVRVGFGLLRIPHESFSGGAECAHSSSLCCFCSFDFRESVVTLADALAEVLAADDSCVEFLFVDWRFVGVLVLPTFVTSIT